jgi:hypothetical protein
MTKDKKLLIPVTVLEKAKLQDLARKAGYMSLSAYMRDKGLNKQKQD